jgi:hypothetical protein
MGNQPSALQLRTIDLIDVLNHVYKSSILIEQDLFDFCNEVPVSSNYSVAFFGREVKKRYITFEKRSNVPIFSHIALLNLNETDRIGLTLRQSMLLLTNLINSYGCVPKKYLHLFKELLDKFYEKENELISI